MSYDAIFDNPRGGSTLNHAKLDSVQNAIRAHGVACEVRQGIACPCVNKDSQQPAFNCSVCFGVGYFFDEPLKNCMVPTGEHRIAMGQRNYTKNYRNPTGMNQTGKHIALVYTFTPAEGDLIRPLSDIEVINDEMHVKGQLLIDGQSAERLFHNHILGVEYIGVVNSAKTAVIKYLPGTNFNMNGNLIQWITGAAQPSNGQAYIVRYKANPSYIIISVQATLTVEHDENIPIQYREKLDVVMPYQVELVRLDKRILANRGDM